MQAVYFQCSGTVTICLMYCAYVNSNCEYFVCVLLNTQYSRVRAVFHFLQTVKEHMVWTAYYSDVWTFRLAELFFTCIQISQIAIRHVRLRDSTGNLSHHAARLIILNMFCITIIGTAIVKQNTTARRGRDMERQCVVMEFEIKIVLVTYNTS
jgi:hypothetical protein